VAAVLKEREDVAVRRAKEASEMAEAQAAIERDVIEVYTYKCGTKFHTCVTFVQCHAQLV
jgi:hypothetical protein